jgi:hypothetical protein
LEDHDAVKKINTARQTLARSIWAILFLVLTLHNAAAEEPFNNSDLKQFLTNSNSVPFLEWVRTNSQEQMMVRLMDKPQSIAEFPEAVRFLQDRKWKPERFAYILNHVIVAHQRIGMGKDPSQLLARLDQTTIATRADATQSESDKAATLAMIANAQHDVRKIDKAFAELPPEEVRLMWLHRVDLHKVLDGHLPIKARVLPVSPGKM